MIPSQVSSVWISTSCSSVLEAESDLEEDANPPSEPNTEFQRKMLSNGSRENTTALSTTDLYLNISAQSSCIANSAETIT
jgi:hypothetical protein